MFASCSSDDSGFSLGPGNGTTSIAGSTSEFTIINNHLYVLLGSKLKAFEISSNNVPPLLVSVTDVPANLETIFTRGNDLFIGADNGVYIYDVSLPDRPILISFYRHQTGCDPVIANEQFAYVTIREGNDCGRNNINELITLDISNLENPISTSIIDMVRPRGLGFFQGNLYVGEGIFGLKKFNLEEAYHPELDTFYREIPANDLIGLSETLLITSNEGISQYEGAGDSLKLLSRFR